MNRNSSIFAHQFEVASRLSAQFDKCLVLTPEKPAIGEQFEGEIRSYVWKPGKPLRGSVEFFFSSISLLVRNRPSVIFSHMTEVQSALIAPVTRMLGIDHYLWYAHASKSRYLKWCHFWCTGIITSTEGSCPIKGPKVSIVGQAIDLQSFTRRKFSYIENLRFVHVGRLDSSKRIREIIEVFLKYGPQDATLTLIGESRGQLSQIYMNDMQVDYYEEIQSGKIVFYGKTARSELPSLLSLFDVFLHSFQGSLDKAILEATLIGLPVVTINREFIQEMNSWSDCTEIDLHSELESFLKKSPDQIKFMVDNRIYKISHNHSLDQWASKVSAILLKN